MFCGVSVWSVGVLWRGKAGEEHVSKCECIRSIADAPERAFLQGIKRFTGKYGYTFCLHHGERVCKSNRFVSSCNDISRSPTSLLNRAHLKANKWRKLLLFYSLFLFQGMLPTKY